MPLPSIKSIMPRSKAQEFRTTVIIGASRVQVLQDIVAKAP
jgi:hypothetical protein